MASIPLLLHLLATSPPTPTSNTASMTTSSSSNTFRFVPYGQSSPANVKTISCDGRVPDTTLELTHWTDNVTPDHLYADLSTEIALNFAKARLDGSYEDLNDAVVLNNHYDTDGVLSVWTCLHPQEALKFEQLLVSGAEAGDFGEWTSDEGVKLDCALSALGGEYDDEAMGYEEALRVVPDLLQDLVDTGGTKYERLWGHGYRNALDSWEALEKGRVSLGREVNGNERIAVLTEERDGRRRLSPYALHRGLVDRSFHETTTRVLRVTPSTLEESRWSYEYEKPGHGWVKRLVKRTAIPDVDTSSLVSGLNKRAGEGKGEIWKGGGSSGLVAICRTGDFVERNPGDVVQDLLELDEGAK